MYAVLWFKFEFAGITPNSEFKTFGKADDGQDIDNDGISDVKEGGLKLEVEHGKTSSGTSKVYAKLI